MKPNDWQHIESVFHLALTLSGEEREKYLRQACRENKLLRKEVEALISTFEKQNDFLEQPAFNLGMKVLEGEFADRAQESSLTGQKIGFYEILAKLGSGGMGEVYLAEDTKLKRKVALKFLSASLVDNKWAKRQFVKEAQAVAMLEHPNICPVYGIEEIGEHSFIVMHYIQGETLSNLIRQRFALNSAHTLLKEENRVLSIAHPIEEEQILSITRQITSAVAAAHAHGIIHRDIKTGNIMITPDGQVKVLDFGLAKIIKQQKAQTFGENSSLISQNSLVVGTIAYMSPEQLRAEKLDYRTDIFSLGTVLYELVSGRHPFLQNSNAETITAILTRDPEPINELKTGNSAALNRLIKKCLEKDKERRYESASEMLLELQSLEETSSAKTKLTTGFRLLAASIFIVLLLTIGIFIYKHATRPYSLAVLPFTNLSGDRNNDYISGMTESLIYKLSGSSNLNIKPFTMVSKYKSSEFEAVEIGETLEVDAVLIGRVVEMNRKLLLETRLIRTADGKILWNEDMPLPENSAWFIRNKISEEVASRLQAALPDNNQTPPAAEMTGDPLAFQYYLQGLDYWKRRAEKENNVSAAIEALKLALERDRNFARAHALLASIYVVRPSVNYKALKPSEAVIIANVYARQAVEIDENLCEAHIALGTILHKYNMAWAEAEKEYRRAIEIDPQVAQAYYWYSDLLSVTERYNEALSYSLKSRELDPSSPAADVQPGRVLYYARRFKEAEKQLTDALARNPNNSGAKLMLALVYLETKKADEAVKILEELYTSHKKGYAASLGYAYGKTGRTAEAYRILNELDEIEKKDDFLPAHERALVYIGLENKEEAFRWLEAAYKEPFFGISALNVDPVYDSLREDERFRNLLWRMNFNKT